MSLEKPIYITSISSLWILLNSELWDVVKRGYFTELATIKIQK
jgi:hypothetical protein